MIMRMRFIVFTLGCKDIDTLSLCQVGRRLLTDVAAAGADPAVSDLPAAAH